MKIKETASKYRTILIDPPWQMKVAGQYKGRHEAPRVLPYPTMTLEAIKNIPVGDYAEEGAHLWLWVVNQFMREGFEVLEAYGFKFHQVITWAKPSGFGNYFVSVTEHLLFGYKNKCQWNKSRYLPNYYEWPEENMEPAEQRYHWGRPKAGQHSRKPEGSYELIESISDEARLELFARPLTPLFPRRPGWDHWGNEVESDIQIEVA